MKRPKDLANRSRELRDVSGLGSSTRDFWEFRLLVDHARLPRISPNDFGSGLDPSAPLLGRRLRCENPSFARGGRSTFAPCYRTASDGVTSHALGAYVRCRANPD